MINRIIEYCAKNKFIVFLGTAFLIGWGIWVINKTPLEAIPDLTPVQVIIYTKWEGQSPNIIEDQVTYPIVTALISAPRVQVVRGLSTFGYSYVYVLFKDGTDMYWARSRVLEYLKQINGKLPPGVNPTLGPDATGIGWGLEYVLLDKGHRYNLADLRTFQDWYLRYWLESVHGVSEVAGIGGYQKEFRVNVYPSRLQAYHIPLSRVIDAVRHSNNDVGGASIEINGTEFVIRGNGYIESLKDLGNVVVYASPHGTPVLLKDIADIKYDAVMRRGIADYNGKGDVVGGIVIVRYGADMYKILNDVKAKIKEITPSLPKGVELKIVYDQSQLIKRSVATLREKLIEESIIVSIVSIIFLYSITSALVAIVILPLAILMALIGMYYVGVSSNIMSLGGIAIAIGAMVDASIVMIENANKFLEQEHNLTNKRREEIIIQAAKLVGRPLFFSLLVIAVAFLPIFALTGPEGKLFKPLAYTKTFSMLFAAFLSITLGPTLMTLFIRGKITPEEKNPINRLMIRAYHPVALFALKHKRLILISAVLIILTIIFPFTQLGSEFMPPLNEGTILYMPSTIPGISITQSRQMLQVTDRIIKSFPEVTSVFGKAGKADTSTDPAPLEMIETIINLKPQSQWPRGVTWKGLINQMNAALNVPGVTNAWTMPIKGRTDMLTTGIRTPVGIKIYGPSLTEMENIGKMLENTLGRIPGTRSVFAERAVGGHYIDFDINRQAIARYGLTIDDVEDVIATAIGGMTIGKVIDGRERFAIALRYPRELRDDTDNLKMTLVPTPSGAQIPIGELAGIHRVNGPPMIRDENGMLSDWVYVDLNTNNIGGYVERAQKAVNDEIVKKGMLPAGYTLEWTGEYKYMEHAKKTLMIVIPLTLFIVFLLLYFNKHSVTEALLVMLAIPFSLTGAFWGLYIVHYELSVAVWVGIIALAGVDAETGVVMLVYLDEAYHRWISEGKMHTENDLKESIMYGAVQRIRPKMMTVVAIIMGLAPIMWSHGSGADVMKRIAMPMIGGVVTSAVMELVVYPVIYLYWKKKALPKQGKGET
ncbi:MAG: CusA/CzcA family heavy metal efflux RND transporter [Deltaproteobacteria bacterium]|nr:CusA/CzcA family heavy metal efflux RND transporter [Deltaproteobacteria bacterium]